MTGHFHNPVHYSPAPQYTMPNTYLDKAIKAVPEFGNRISLFTKKLRLAQYADGTIYDYRLNRVEGILQGHGHQGTGRTCPSSCP